MDIYNFNYKIEDITDILEDTTLMIGKFNVFHKGHQELFNKAKEVSGSNKIGITLFNFPEQEIITTKENRLSNLSEIGFDFVLLIDFNFDFKSLKANEFIDHVVKKYKIKNFVVGEEFRFGANRM
jgi:riboflavin kinase/FMN adenylyltransferase